MKFRLDLGLGSQPLKLAVLIVLVWGVLTFGLLHGAFDGPMDDTMRDTLILVAVPPLVVLACAALVQWLGTGRR